MNHYEIKDSCRANFHKYLHRAFAHIPKISEANILDIGCGSGVSTLEVAKITDGKIIAIDSDKESLETLKKKIKQNHLESRISIIHDSIFKAKIPENYFDIILAEGIFNMVGFKKGFNYLLKHLKKNGVFIIHDKYANQEVKLNLFKTHSCKLLYSIYLDENVWGDLYIHCLEQKIKQLKAQNPEIKDLNQIFKTELSEIKLFAKTPELFQSIFYIVQKQ